MNCLCPQAPGRKETRAPLACIPAPLGPGIRRDVVFSGFSLLQGLVQGSPLKRRVLSVPRSTILSLQAPAAPFLRSSEGLALCTHCGNLCFPLGHKVPGRAQTTTSFKCFFPDSSPPRVQDQAPENPSFLACSLGTRSFLCFKVLSVLCAPYLSLQLSAQTPLLQESLSPTQGRASHPTAPRFSWAPPSKRHLPHWCRDLYILTYITHTVTRVHINIHIYTRCRSLAKSRLTLTTSRTAVHRAPLSMGFSRQEYWSGLPLPSPRDLPNPGIKLRSPALAGGFFTTEPPGKPHTLSNICLLSGPQTQVC